MAATPLSTVSGKSPVIKPEGDVAGLGPDWHEGAPLGREWGAGEQGSPPPRPRRPRAPYSLPTPERTVHPDPAHRRRLRAPHTAAHPRGLGVPHRHPQPHPSGDGHGIPAPHALPWGWAPAGGKDTGAVPRRPPSPRGPVPTPFPPGRPRRGEQRSGHRAPPPSPSPAPRGRCWAPGEPPRPGMLRGAGAKRGEGPGAGRAGGEGSQARYKAHAASAGLGAGRHAIVLVLTSYLPTRCPLLAPRAGIFSGLGELQLAQITKEGGEGEEGEEEAGGWLDSGRGGRAGGAAPAGSPRPRGVRGASRRASRIAHTGVNVCVRVCVHARVSVRARVRACLCARGRAERPEPFCGAVSPPTHTHTPPQAGRTTQGRWRGTRGAFAGEGGGAPGGGAAPPAPLRQVLSPAGPGRSSGSAGCDGGTEDGSRPPTRFHFSPMDASELLLEPRAPVPRCLNCPRFWPQAKSPLPSHLWLCHTEVMNLPKRQESVFQEDPKPASKHGSLKSQLTQVQKLVTVTNGYRSQDLTPEVVSAK